MQVINQVRLVCVEPLLLSMFTLGDMNVQVGAFSLCATLNCEEFANVHSATAHYDVNSFVGLAWRPAGESICCGKIAAFSVKQCTLMSLFVVRCALQRSTGRVELSTLGKVFVRIVSRD